MTSQAQSYLPSYSRTLVLSIGWLPGPGRILPTTRVFWHLALRSKELGAVIFPRKCSDLAGSIEQGFTMAADGGEDAFLVYSDAGFAGADTKSQNGLVIMWAGSIITWRSSRAAVSALSTAEAELCAAALGWQVTKGIRYLLNTLRIFPN